MNTNPTTIAAKQIFKRRRRQDFATLVLASLSLSLIAFGLYGYAEQQPSSGDQFVPATWFWLALLGLMVVGGVLSYFVIRRNLSFSILNRPVRNAPITREHEDRLGFAPLAQALSLFIRHEQTRPPLTVAVTAAWGKGKSSLLRLLQQQLEGQGVQTVWFNVWYHQHEPVLLAPLLKAIIEQGIPPWWSLRGLSFRYQLFLVRLFDTGSPLLLGVGVSMFFIGCIVLLLLVASTSMSIPESGIHPLVEEIATLAASVLVWLWDDTAFRHLLFGEWKTFLIQLSNSGTRDALLFGSCISGVVGLWAFFAHFLRPFPASPSALLSTLTARRFSLHSAEEQTGFRERFARHFHSVCEASEQLTIFIDDLDRCEPAKTAELLECINYLSESGNCRIIIATAQEIVTLQLGEHFHELAESKAANEVLAASSSNSTLTERSDAQARQDYAHDYLRKLFQLHVPVPQFTPERQQRLFQDAQADTEEGQGQADWEAFKAQAKQFWRGVRSLLGRILPMALLILLVQQVNLLSQSSWATVSPDLLARQTKLHAQAQEAWAYIENLEKEAKADQPKRQTTLTAQARDLSAQGKRIEEDLSQLETLWREQRRRDFARLEATLAQEIQAVLAQRDVHLQRSDKDSKSGKAWASAPSIKTEALPDRPLPATQATVPSRDAAPWYIWILIALGTTIPVFGVPLFYWYDYKRVTDSPEFAQVLTVWGPLLLARLHLCSPREGKRFVNLARYLSLRINLSEHHQPGWIERQCRTLYGKVLGKKMPELKAEKVLAEEKIVALTALYLARPEGLPDTEALENYLLQPGRWLTDQVHLHDPEELFSKPFEGKLYEILKDEKGGDISEFLTATEAEVALFLEHVSDVAFNG